MLKLRDRMWGCPARPVRTPKIAELPDAVVRVAPVMPQRSPIAPYSYANVSRPTAPRDDRPTRHAVGSLGMRTAPTSAVEPAAGDSTCFLLDNILRVHCRLLMKAGSIRELIQLPAYC